MIVNNRYVGPVLPTRVKQLEWQRLGRLYRATGYGCKTPTVYMVKYDHRWRRVYCDIYANSGVSYMLVRGEEIYLGDEDIDRDGARREAEQEEKND